MSVVDVEIGKLRGTRRTQTGKGVARKLRRAGQIPAVLYGGDGENEMITLDPSAMLKAVDPAKRRNTVFTLTIDEGDGATTEQKVMIKDYQRDTLLDDWLHADFIRVTDDTQVHVEIPFILEGTAIGIQAGGKVSQVFHTLPVVCATNMIPTSISVDVTEMDLGATLAVSDLVVPDGAVISLPRHQTVITVLLPRGLKDEEEGEVSEEGEEGETEGEPAEAVAE